MDRVHVLTDLISKLLYSISIGVGSNRGAMYQQAMGFVNGYEVGVLVEDFEHLGNEYCVPGIAMMQGSKIRHPEFISGSFSAIK